MAHPVVSGMEGLSQNLAGGRTEKGVEAIRAGFMTVPTRSLSLSSTWISHCVGNDIFFSVFLKHVRYVNRYPKAVV